MKKILHQILFILGTISVANAQNNSSSHERALQEDAQKLNMTVEQLKSIMNQNSWTKSNTSNKAATIASVNPACTNMNFESGNITGWTVSNGTTFATNNSCLMASCCPSANPNYTILSNGFIDPYMPTSPLNSQFGTGGNGTRFIRLNDAPIGSGDQQRLTQSFSVTTSNNLFKYAYMYVSYNNTGHSCCDNPFLNIRFFDANNNPVNLLLPTFSVTMSSNCPNTYSQTTAGLTACVGNTLFANTSWIYGSADLTPYIGSYVTFELNVGDCASLGHTSYVYFDAECAPLTFSVNGGSMQLDSTNNVCSSSLPMTLNAPNGFLSYAWSGPSSASTQSISVNAYGMYTLTMTALGQCCPVIKQFNISPCAGITEMNTKSNELYLYPNPAKNEIYLKNVSDNYTIEVYDALGKLVMQKTDLNKEHKIDVSGYNKGLYFLKTYDSKSTIKTYRFVKE